jgi:uncharacterized spore protein YtfJ
MEALETLLKAGEGMRAGTVFGEPIVRDGLTVIPVARVTGGGGGGAGAASPDTEAEHAGAASSAEAAPPAGEGSGGGFGFTARPIGVFVIRDDKVVWEPAVDITRVVLGGQLVGIVALLVIRSIVKMVRSRST